MKPSNMIPVTPAISETVNPGQGRLAEINGDGTALTVRPPARPTRRSDMDESTRRVKRSRT